MRRNYGANLVRNEKNAFIFVSSLPRLPYITFVFEFRVSIGRSVGDEKAASAAKASMVKGLLELAGAMAPLEDGPFRDRKYHRPARISV